MGFFVDLVTWYATLLLSNPLLLVGMPILVVGLLCDIQDVRRFSVHLVSFTTSALTFGAWRRLARKLFPETMIRLLLAMLVWIPVAYVLFNQKTTVILSWMYCAAMGITVLVTVIALEKNGTSQDFVL